MKIMGQKYTSIIPVPWGLIEFTAFRVAGVKPDEWAALSTIHKHIPVNKIVI
ncbi:MAG TPA: hypothetical protein PLX02_14730 [Syntrophorhabdaceae bacterium]|nr:hypothetical protein [Syntrophorhabdaceae bacterium]HQM82862.1 hypothetical protein [Syntrophorhabdaceae bacterium]